MYETVFPSQNCCPLMAPWSGLSRVGQILWPWEKIIKNVLKLNLSVERTQLKNQFGQIRLIKFNNIYCSGSQNFDKTSDNSAFHDHLQLEDYHVILAKVIYLFTLEKKNTNPTCSILFAVQFAILVDFVNPQSFDGVSSKLGVTQWLL